MREDLQHLAETYAQEPTAANKDALVLASVPLVRSIVGKITLPDHPLASREDLENAGLLGLLQAIEQYDPSRGTPFASYIYGRVRGAVVDYLRSIDVLSRDSRRKLAEAQQAFEVLSQTLGEEPSDQDVADYMGISLAEYHQILMGAQRRFALSLNEHSDENDHQSPTSIEKLAHPEASELFESIERKSLVEYIMRIIQKLPEREQTILALYYFEDLTLREIASLLNLTEARISQILGKTLLKIRTALEKNAVRIS